MYLKSLALRGFKSFADKTILKFEPGVTAIVGPNGSGKSNITDAILWALGEQSPRSLRGGSMEDVIFAGSESRQPVGLAEVVLVIDNSDEKLPIEFSEVTIARRVYRDGESEYFINNSPCRLIDIQELLSGSGLGRGMYSIIGQGRIEEALQARPEERRMLIEEAAGVLKYKRRRDRAVKRLASLDSNLIRIQDISGEVKRQLAPLKRQAELARKHVELSEELKRLELALAVVDLKELQGRWAALEAEGATLSNGVDALKAELAEADGEAEAAQAVLDAEEESSGVLAERRRRIQSVEDRLQAVASLVAERARNAEERLEMLSFGAYSADTRKLALERKVQQSDRELEQLDMALSKAEERLLKAKAELMEASARSQELASKLNELQKSVDSDERTIADYKAAASNLDLAIKTRRMQLEVLAEQKSSVDRRMQAIELSLREAEESRAKLVSEAQDAEKALDAIDRQREKLRSELESARREAAEAEAQAESIRAKISALKEMAPRRPDLSMAVAALGDDALSVIGEAISVKRGYERAIEAALGSDVFCIVVERSESARRMAADGIKSASLLPLDRAKGGRSEAEVKQGRFSGRLIPALSAIEYEPPLAPALEALLGSVFIAPSLEDALECDVDGLTIVTLDGEAVYGTGKISLKAGTGSAGELRRRREIEDLIEGLKTVKKRVERGKAVRERIEGELREVERRSLEASRALEAKRAALEALSREVESLTGDRDALLSEATGIEAKIAAYSERLESEGKKLEESNGLIAEKSAGLESKKVEIARLRSERERSLKSESDASLKVEKAEIELKALAGRRRGVEKERFEALKELAELKEAADREKRDIRKLELVRERASPLISAIESLVVIAREISDSLRRVFETREERIAGLRESLARARDKSTLVKSRLEEAKGKLHELDVVKTQLEMEVSGAVSRIVDELDVPLERALQMSISEDRATLSEKASLARRRIAALGPVNPMAIEEHEALERRAALLEKQLQDISESRRVLGKIIRAIDRKIRERFMIAFDQINAHFQELFERLFPNGRAELVLTEPDDLDISGVDIVARPSGKKLQRLSLLSGGEKSLVSLAFLFSLYIDEPCPFYVLDEAEAALDDVNLNRLVKLLNETKGRTQYLVITHQRRTMEMADALYGVSMQNDGVSKLISQKFSEAAKVV